MARVKGRAKKAALTVGIVGTLVVGFVGVLHAPFARPLLMKIGGCPVGKASAAEIEEGRMAAVRKARGTDPAPARPALGFSLDAATPEDVHAWAARHDVSCTDKREGMLVTCKNVEARTLGDRPGETGTIDEVSFAFRPSDRKLVNVTAMSFALTPEEAVRRTHAGTARLSGALGAGETAGEVSNERFASGGFATATTSWNFRDYMADVTTTSFGTRGVAVREHFISASE
jgi:hypothetical protein